MKKLFKKISLLLVFILLITTMVACKDQGISIPKEDISKIQEDIQALETIEVKNNLLNVPTSGAKNGSTITWTSQSNFITPDGIVLPQIDSISSSNEKVLLTFELDGEKETKTYDVKIPMYESPTIDTVKSVPFKNKTTEYDIKDANFNLYSNKDGSVSYVAITEFLTLLEGLISKDVFFNIEETNTSLNISYEYFDEEDNTNYELTFTANTKENKITVPDPGFFYAFIESTETNYSRNIYYDKENSLNHSEDGTGISLDLNKYNMDILNYNGKTLIPLSLASLLFASPNYYNIHYNGDQLTGFYFIPDKNQASEVLTSSLNGKDIPADLLIHNFNFLAFYFDNFYGLKDYKNIKTFYNILLGKSRRLLSKNAVVVDNAIFELITKDIDELHTYYSIKSHYQELSSNGPGIESIDQLGPNAYSYYMEGLFAVDEAIDNKWGNSNPRNWAAYSEYRKPVWLANSKILVISLDSFDTADIVEDTTFSNEVIKNILKSDTDHLLPELVGSNRYIYFNSSEDDLNLAEVLIKDLSQDVVTSYGDKLIQAGFTKHTKPEDYNEPIFKNHNYFTKTINDVTYMVQLKYNQEFNLFYLGISNVAPLSYEEDWPYYPDFDTLIESDSAIYLEFYLEKTLKTNTAVTHGILDLTWNSGGNIGALYRVIGMLFNKPFAVSNFDPTLGSKSTNVISINSPVNFSNLNWSLLISKVSFSAGNMMPTIVKQNNLGPIIGVKSGGGAASVTPVYLPIGTIFASSSTNVAALVTGDNTTASPYVYTINEEGITPDHIIPTYLLYDSDTLASILLD